MHVGNLLQHVEYAADRIDQAARNQERKTLHGKVRHESRQIRNDAPPQKKVEQRRDPARAKYPERLAGNARKRYDPHEHSQIDSPVVPKRDQAKRRICSRDEQVDPTVVEHFEHALGALYRDSVVQRRHEVLHQHGDGVDERRRKLHAAAGAHRDHHEDGNRRNGKKRADAMRHGVGDFLAERVLAHVTARALGVRGRVGGLVFMLARLGESTRLELRRGPCPGRGGMLLHARRRRGEQRGVFAGGRPRR